MWDEAHEWKNTDWRERAENAEELAADLKRVNAALLNDLDRVRHALGSHECGQDCCGGLQDVRAALDDTQSPTVEPESPALPAKE